MRLNCVRFNSEPITISLMKLNLNDTFTKELPADPVRDNSIRQVPDAAFSFVTPRKPTKPELVHYSPNMLEQIGLDKHDATSNEFLDIFSGKEVFPNSSPYAMCYSGHQFGNWAGQLGDGRAINLFEVAAKEKQWALQLKGAGKTPYSRGADGLAVLRSSIREYLCSEAMFHLGVPTTRALSLMLTGDEVLRDMLYDGNPAYEKGAIVCRAAESFIRFGNFQNFMAYRDTKNLKVLADYTIRNFFGHLGNPSKETYIEFFQEVVNLTMRMIIHWERVGFVHGVMNTDNMSVLGLTIDYGPYGWLEDFDPGWTPNTTDAGQKRYRFGNQANIAIWNLMQFGNSLYLLVEDASPFEAILNDCQSSYVDLHLKMMSDKLGLRETANREFITNLENLLFKSEIDMTIFFRLLSKFEPASPDSFWDSIRNSSYQSELDSMRDAWTQFLRDYAKILSLENWNNEARAQAMNLVNPKYVLRNYMAQLAIDAADNGDYSVLNEIYNLLLRPYDEQIEMEKWFVKRPDWAKTKVGCSMLSCSS